MLRWLIATLHLLTLPLGLGAIWARSRALSLTRSADDLHRVFVADNLWGLAAVLWLVTGLLREFAGLEEGTRSKTPTSQRDQQRTRLDLHQLAKPEAVL